jgi:hypothetical protein
MALRMFLILRKLRSSYLEGRTPLVQPTLNFARKGELICGRPLT